METNKDNPGPVPARPSLLRNWLSLTGLVTVIGALFSFIQLFILDTVAHFSNPYISILTWMVTPAFLVLGLFLTVVGELRERRRRKGAVSLIATVQIDLSRPRDRRNMAIFLVVAVLFLLLSAVGSYNSYQFTESVQFCGETCHTVMKPELTAHALGPHARVACADCHIGPGASWFVRSKLSGSYQVYATLFYKYPRPIPTPIKNLRPARETCEQCHWPQRFIGNLDRTFNYFLSDPTNTPYSIRMLLKIGGSDPLLGPVAGIHWHTAVSNRVEYAATDPARQVVPWVRMTDPQGVVTVFRAPRFTNSVSQDQIRTMDCIDCHNRPSHQFASPDDAVALALALGQIDRTLPWIKTNVISALTRPYHTDTEAREGIATALAESYPNDPRVSQIIPVAQRIYDDNFFPEMQSDWKAYPNNIGHLMWAGCFRCHDGSHKSADGRVITASCEACHIILAQGSGPELQQLTPEGQPFKHPGGDVDNTCNECHDGTL
jgi:nitrate/TMAO reductase-like tetraheme cytochrome c subunit